MVASKYARRVARLPAVFELLAAHPDGLSVADLAGQLGIPGEELREDLLAFFCADTGGLLGLSRPPVLEFVGTDGDDEDPATAEVVRIVDERPAEELGVEYVDAGELALVFTAARAMLDIDPGDSDLAGAVAVLTETMFGTDTEPAQARTWELPLEPLQDAVQQHRTAHIVYSRSWLPGVVERDIDPYRLVQTRRGWEVDAGPPDEQGRLRTYLLSNVRSVRLGDASFEPPADLGRRLAGQRQTATVQVRVPHTGRWAADMYAEEVTVVGEDESSVTLELAMLPPVAQRVGLLILAAGDDTVVIDDPALLQASLRLADELLAHHRRVPV